jgi:hypothetical protein
VNRRTGGYFSQLMLLEPCPPSTERAGAGEDHARQLTRLEPGTSHRCRADQHGVERNGHRLAYADLQRAVEYHQPRYTSDELAVALDFGAGRIVVFTESDKAWNANLAALDAHPRSSKPSIEWRLALVAAGADEQIELLRT